jgi:hypothetical protein
MNKFQAKVIRYKISVMVRGMHIYTDGAAKGNPRQGGYGVVMEA